MTTTLNTILLNNTPLYADVLSIINDYSVGDKTYWKGEFQKCIQEINQNGSIVFMIKYEHPFRAVLKYDWKKIQKEQNINTKKKIADYYLRTGIIQDETQHKKLMRMKKEELLNHYVERKFLTTYAYFSNKEQVKKTIYWKYTCFMAKSR